ncbi:phenylalanine--tRNA ligase subunit beta [Candidatus Peribacteria bacterium RIFOXYC2_FULL_58_10]|nr:MAG: phenylalanine--tRNA ligase subunit beta [Candidatus Peribacteria bacterium RIFOXYC2_FULL_58_10]OGJ84328.1 MAG: phenylalanine--tRNA ligase subunit beta [Candidatus Peribacteria bacterium RIFOXYD2_FULL_58_15]
MKISLHWLSDFIDWKETDPLTIADRITASVGEVEEVEVQGANLEGCCVGKILSLKQHPNADRLAIAEVKTDRGTKRVVCGGTNLREGMRVAFAHVGTRVKWHGTEEVILEKAAIRGEESEGMICAGEELGIAALFSSPSTQGERPIVDLGDGDEGVGEPLKKFLKFDDVILHVDNHAITHRADLFSHVGFARECVALKLASWKKRPAVRTPAFADAPLPFKILVEDEKLVPRYCACTLSISGLGETPAWMRQRLEATGWRSINLPIDITNYVMMEVGMPLHSFDAADIQGAVRMRAAREKERITTLDEEDRTLSPGALIMEDDRGIFDLLGIMGGLRGSTKPTTRRIWLHSAVVDPVNTRSTCIAMGHRTDAATVYEKGVPLCMAQQGLLRALELFLAHVPGARITSKLHSWGTDGKAHAVPFSAESAARVLGLSIPEKRIDEILTDLGFTVRKKSVTPPLWRLKDVQGEHDVVEEVGRIAGYEAIEPALPSAFVQPPARDQRVHVLRDALKAEGYTEILPLSLLSPALLKKCGLDPGSAVELLNPIGEELSLLHTSVLPGLLAHAERNLLLTEDVLETFTWARVVSAGAGETQMGLLLARRTDSGIKDDPFLLTKAHLSDALSNSGYTMAIRPLANPPAFAHPGRCAEIVVSDTTVGILFEVHPATRAAFALPKRAACALVNLSQLLSLTPATPIARPLPQFPAITYDVTLPFNFGRSVGDLLKAMRSKTDLLESVDIADLYAKGDNQLYNLTLRCIYRAKDRTLTETEAKKAHDAVLLAAQ